MSKKLLKALEHANIALHGRVLYFSSDLLSSETGFSVAVLWHTGSSCQVYMHSKEFL